MERVLLESNKLDTASGTVTLKKTFGVIVKILGKCLMVVYALFSIVPLLWMLVSSFSRNTDIIGNSLPFSLKAFVPIPFSTEGYRLLVTSGFFHAVMNTMIVAFAIIIAGLFVNSLSGYAYALFSFPGKRIFFSFVMLTMALPADVIAIPLYVEVNKFGWIGTFLALIIPMIANGFTIFLFRQAVLGIPRSLVEAARVDGMGWFQIYYRIILPLISGNLIGGTLILLLGVWQAFLWPLLAGNTRATQMIQVAVSFFQTQHQTYWNAIFAGSVVAIAIPTVVLVFLQRHFRPSISNSGNK